VLKPHFPKSQRTKNERLVGQRCVQYTKGEKHPRQRKKKEKMWNQMARGKADKHEGGVGGSSKCCKVRVSSWGRKKVRSDTIEFRGTKKGSRQTLTREKSLRTRVYEVEKKSTERNRLGPYWGGKKKGEHDCNGGKLGGAS